MCHHQAGHGGGGVFAPGHLGELTQIVPFEMVDEALAATGTVQARMRDLPSRVVVYLLLAGCLFAELGYRQVWRKLTAGLDGLPVASPDGQRAGAGPPPGRASRRCGALFDLLRGPAAGDARRGVRWRGLLVVRDRRHHHGRARQPRRTWPGSPSRRGNHGGTGYPQLRLLALVACGTRTVIDAVFGPDQQRGDQPTPAGCCAACTPGMIVLADRNFAAASADRPASPPPAPPAGPPARPTASCRSWPATATAPTCRGSAPCGCASSTARSPSPPAPGGAPASTGWPPPCSTTAATRPPSWSPSTTSAGRSKPPTWN